MLMIDNIKNYLYDKNYFINIYDDYIHIFNYQRLNDFREDKVILKMDNFTIIIKGNNFLVTKMLENEILIKGDIASLEKIYE